MVFFRPKSAVVVIAFLCCISSRAEAQRTPAELARSDSGRPAYTRADVDFMQGMIGHHAQAIVMARWSATHNASDGVRTLAGRIEVAQQDEIASMQRWLGDRKENVPEPVHAQHDMMAGHDMAGMQTLMPGMLTPAQMSELESARGKDFDRLFLTYMIQHHRGALTMVDKLFAVPGAGQDITIFRFASDVDADQTTEINRMNAMLEARGFPTAQ